MTFLSLASARLGLLFLLLVSFVVDVAPSSAQSDMVLDKIVSVVDGEIILKSEVDALVIGVVQQQRIPANQELWTDALNELIDQKTLLIHAKRDTTLEIVPEQVQAEIDGRIQRLAQQAGSEARLEELYGRPLRRSRPS